MILTIPKIKKFTFSSTRASGDDPVIPVAASANVGFYPRKRG